MRDEIDEELRQLIIDLNAAGFATCSSCQGKRSQQDFDENKHCNHAFITFDDLPSRFNRKAKTLGLELYNGGISICPAYEDEEPAIFIRHNLLFPAKIRELFGLTTSTN
jgi:hypothetical protein